MSSEDKRFIGRLLEGIILYSVGVFLTYSLWRTYNSFWGVTAAGIAIIIVSGLVGTIDSRVLTSTGYRSGERFQIIGALFGSSYIAACLCALLYLWATNPAPSIDIWFIQWPLFRIDTWIDGTIWQVAAILPPGLVILMAEFLRQDSFEAEQKMAAAYRKPKKSSTSSSNQREQLPVPASAERQPARLVSLRVVEGSTPGQQILTAAPRPQPNPTPPVQPAPMPAYPPLAPSAAAAPVYHPPTPAASSVPQPVAPAAPPSPVPLPPAAPIPLPLSADELAELRRAELALDEDHRAGMRVLRYHNGQEVTTAQLKKELAALRPNIKDEALRQIFFDLKEIGLAGNDGPRRVYWARIIPGLWQPK